MKRRKNNNNVFYININIYTRTDSTKAIRWQVDKIPKMLMRNEYEFHKKNI